MAQTQHTPAPPSLEEAIITLFCEIDDAYRILNPRTDLYEAIKKLSDSEVLTLALFQQLRGVESERSFLRDAQRFFVHLFPGVANMYPSSLHRRVRKRGSSGALSNPCAALSFPNWLATPRPSSSTRRSWSSCTRARLPNRRDSTERRG